VKKFTWIAAGLLALLLQTTIASAQSTDSFTFTNNTGKDVDDLHIEWTRSVDITSHAPFKKGSGSGTSRADFSKGTVKADGTCEVEVSYDGTDPKVKSWYWTIGGEKVRTEKATDVVGLSTDTRGGLTTMVMTTSAGKITTYLPDTLWAGAVVQGTVIATPNTEPGSAETLRGMVVQVGDKKITGGSGAFVATLAGAGSLIKLLGKGGSAVCETPVPLGSIPVTPPAVSGAPWLQPPAPVVSGQPIQIPGGFDPSQAIDCTVNGKPALTLAANQHDVVILPSEPVSGAFEATVKNGDKEGTVQGAAVKVSLSASKSTLMSGEPMNLTMTVGPFVGVPDDKFPCTVQVENRTPNTLNMGGQSALEIPITKSALAANGTFSYTIACTGVSPGPFEVGATLKAGSCGHKTHEFGIDKLNKGNDDKGWYVEWREDCHEGTCHKRKDHAGDHSYSWKNCKDHASKDHKDYFTTEEDRDAEYERLEKERKKRKAANGF